MNARAKVQNTIAALSLILASAPGCQSVLSGVEVPGSPVVFLIDVSSSMEGQRESEKVVDRAKDRVTARAIGAARNRMGGDVADGARSLLQVFEPPDAPTKLALAKRDLKQIIDRLAPDTRFTIVLFASDSLAWKPVVVEATPANKETAKAFVEEARSAPFTNIGTALANVLAMPDIAHVVLVSDGAPTDSSPSEILGTARRLAVSRGIRITTVGVGADQDANLMQSLARMTGGRYYRR